MKDSNRNVKKKDNFNLALAQIRTFGTVLKYSRLKNITQTIIKAEPLKDS